MLVDTHCHINMMIKKDFDVPLQESDIPLAQNIIDQAGAKNVSLIINVGTRRIENSNCILLAKTFDTVFATVGIHPNDSDEWQEDFALLKSWVQKRRK